MARIGETLFRFAGALLLGATAVGIDNPELLDMGNRSSRGATVQGRLAPEAAGSGLEIKITPGKRAFGIRINAVASQARQIQPNSRVDVLVVLPDSRGRSTAKILMSNMRVLAIGAAPERADRAAMQPEAVAALEVTPSEAEALAVASSQGSLQLLLRGNGDPDGAAPAVPANQCAEPNGRLYRDLLNRGPCPAVPRLAPPEFVVPKR